jgi:hypothetical protein
MRSKVRNKLIAASFAVPAAGVLAGTAALLEVLIPTGAVVGFVTRMAVLGVAGTGVVMAYVWACDKCERHAVEQLDQLPDAGQPDRDDAASRGAPTSPQPAELRVVRGTKHTVYTTPLPSSYVRRVPTLRGYVSPKAARSAISARGWHGQ